MEKPILENQSLGWLIRLLSRTFEAPELIDGNGRCPTYLTRWTIFTAPWKWFSVYLHYFTGDDWTLDFHDHPKRFISIGLWGWYLEDTPIDWKFPCSMHAECQRTKKFQAPWIRSFPANHIHRLRVPSKNCWTLVIVLKTVRSWGFWHKTRWVKWNEYADPNNADATGRKACP